MKPSQQERLNRGDRRKCQAQPLDWWPDVHYGSYLDESRKRTAWWSHGIAYSRFPRRDR